MAAPRASDELASREEMRALCDEVLGFSRADEAEVTLSDSDVTQLRFARNAPSTSARVRARTVAVRSSFGTRSATAQGNQLDRASLEALVRRSEELARRSPEDPEFVPALGPQEYAPTPRPDEEPEPATLLSAGIARVIEDARALGLSAAGYTECELAARAIANSAGLFGYHLGREAELSATVRTSDGKGSGWAAGAAAGAAGLDFAGISRAAVQKARDSAEARPLASGTYAAVLEPDCVASLLGLFAQGLNARPAEEGRSFFSRPGGGTRLGERLFPDWVELRSDPSASAVPSVPWGAEGVPHRPTAWIEGGALANLYADRAWAAKSGRAPLAPAPNVLVPGGEGGVAELVRGLERGLLFTSFWYIRAVDPRQLLYTGLTRDGVFWVEDGEVRHAVNNFRWNESPVKVLENAVARSAAVRTGGRGGDNRNCVVPALRVSAFRLTGVSDAV